MEININSLDNHPLEVTFNGTMSVDYVDSSALIEQIAEAYGDGGNENVSSALDIALKLMGHTNKPMDAETACGILDEMALIASSMLTRTELTAEVRERLRKVKDASPALWSEQPAVVDENTLAITVNGATLNVDAVNGSALLDLILEVYDRHTNDFGAIYALDIAVQAVKADHPMDQETAARIIWAMEGLAHWMLNDKLSPGTRSWLEKLTGDDQRSVAERMATADQTVCPAEVVAMTDVAAANGGCK